MFFRKNEKGRSMIEMLGVLAIMGIITALAVSSISGGTKSVKMNSYKSEILSIVSEVKELYGDDADYTDVASNTTALRNMGLTGDGILDTFPNAVVAINNNDGATFLMRVTFDDQENCSLIATMQDVSDELTNNCSSTKSVDYFFN